MMIVDIGSGQGVVWPSYAGVGVGVDVGAISSSGSQEPNPILSGIGSEWPTLPWLYGTSEAPEGDFCRICFSTFKHGGQ
jgi:hypothetical protein